MNPLDGFVFVNSVIPFSGAMQLLPVAITAVAVILIIYVLRKISHSKRLGKTSRTRILRLQPLMEVVLVLGIVLWAVTILLAGYAMYLTALIISLILGGLWLIRFLFYDIGAGLVLRTENILDRGESVIANDQHAVIRTVGLRSLTVEKSDGTIMRIPYSILVRSPLVKPTSHTEAKSHTFSLAVSENDYFALREKIRKAALNAPWSLVTLTPGIEMTREGEGPRAFRVTVFATSTTYFPEIERFIRESINPGEPPDGGSPS